MDKRIIRTKREIRKAFLQIVLEKDINKITIKEVSEKAGINRKTFYAHYNCIDDVLHDIEYDLVDKFTKSLDEMIENNDLSSRKLLLNLEAAVKSDYDYNHLLNHLDNTSIIFNECRREAFNYFDKMYLSKFSEEDKVKYRYLVSFVAGGIVMGFERYMKYQDITLEEFSDMVDDYLEPFIQLNTKQ